MLPYPFVTAMADCMYAYAAVNNLGSNDTSVLEMPKTAKIRGRYIKAIKNIADNVV